MDKECVIVAVSKHATSTAACQRVRFWDTRTPEPQPVKCLAGDHPIFVRETGSIVAHYDANQGKCSANETGYGEAWLYRNPDPRWVCGASMMMTRQACEAW